MAIVLAGLTGYLPSIPEGGWKTFGCAKGRPELYNVTYRCLDAQWWGVAQRRRRLFFVGCLNSSGLSSAPVLLERESGAWDYKPRRKAGKGFTPYTRNGAAANHPAIAQPVAVDPSSSYPVSSDEALALSGAAQHGGSHELRDTDHLNQIPYNVIGLSGNAKERHAYPTETSTTLDSFSGAESKNAGGTYIVTRQEETYRMQGFGDYESDDLASALKSRDYKDATDLVRVEEVYSIGTHASSLGESNNGEGKFNRSVGMGINEDRANSLRTGGVNRIGGTMGIRRLMPVECERLQALPDGWTEYGANGKAQSDTTRYQQTGNGLAVTVADWIISRILKVERGEL